MQVDLDGLADNARIAREVVLPEAIAENRLGRASALVGTGRDQASAQNRTHAQHLEVIRRRQRAVNALRLARSGDGHKVVVITDQAGEGFGVVAQVDKVRIGERRGRMLAPLAALDCNHVPDVVRAGNRVEQGGADPTQDCAVGANSQGQREHRRERKARSAAQLAQRVPDICQQLFHRVFLSFRIGLA